ncbi:hypothetical protein HOF78_02905 [Candidatus Woesearchaeota archaeon]|jgi:predicted AlkP superfamily pyrophosphatase or phosphodiesterase|nr:hypothetical protein [Candidatus Woesearchaeota archaeon]MBT6044503.1 hypothetical protein [Candidatus Woesearchaeota archaeon]
MSLPDYNGGNLINLMSSLEKGMGGSSKYPHLTLLKPSEISGYKNVILLIIDGLGYNYILKKGGSGFLKNNLRGKLTTVFPAVTSSAIPSILSGRSPQENGMAGWHIYLDELDEIIISLRYIYTKNKKAILGKKNSIDKIFKFDPMGDRIKRDSFIVQSNKIINSDFSVSSGGNSKRIGFKDIKGCFKNLEKVIKSSSKKKYIYGYWMDFDSMCHDHGVISKEVHNHYRDLDEKISLFVDSIKGTDSLVVITSDHGMIDVPKKKVITVGDHPELQEMLALPLCGDFRFAFCYVKPGMQKKFKKYVKDNLKHCCEIYESKTLQKKGVFGSFKPHKKFLNRIGDYTIIMNENYAIYNYSLEKGESHNLGDHGGLSEDEMHIPLIVIDPDK